MRIAQLLGSGDILSKAAAMDLLCLLRATQVLANSAMVSLFVVFRLGSSLVLHGSLCSLCGCASCTARPWNQRHLCAAVREAEGDAADSSPSLFPCHMLKLPSHCLVVRHMCCVTADCVAHVPVTYRRWQGCGRQHAVLRRWNAAAGFVLLLRAWRKQRAGASLLRRCEAVLPLR